MEETKSKFNYNGYMQPFSAGALVFVVLLVILHMVQTEGLSLKCVLGGGCLLLGCFALIWINCKYFRFLKICDGYIEMRPLMLPFIVYRLDFSDISSIVVYSGYTSQIVINKDEEEWGRLARYHWGIKCCNYEGIIYTLKKRLGDKVFDA